MKFKIILLTFTLVFSSQIGYSVHQVLETVAFMQNKGQLEVLAFQLETLKVGAYYNEKKKISEVAEKLGELFDNEYLEYMANTRIKYHQLERQKDILCPKESFFLRNVEIVNYFEELKGLVSFLLPNLVAELGTALGTDSHPFDQVITAEQLSNVVVYYKKLALKDIDAISFYIKSLRSLKISNYKNYLGSINTTNKISDLIKSKAIESFKAEVEKLEKSNECSSIMHSDLDLKAILINKHKFVLQHILHDSFGKRLFGLLGILLNDQSVEMIHQKMIAIDQQIAERLIVTGYSKEGIAEEFEKLLLSKEEHLLNEKISSYLTSLYFMLHEVKKLEEEVKKVIMNLFSLVASIIKTKKKIQEIKNINGSIEKLKKQSAKEFGELHEHQTLFLKEKAAELGIYLNKKDNLSEMLDISVAIEGRRIVVAVLSKVVKTFDNKE